MPTPAYAPLRVHGVHSLLVGVDAPRRLCERARELGLGHLALTDTDGMAGLVDFLRAAREVGLHPVVGAELSDAGGRPGRLVALVQTEPGYTNLCRLISARQLGADPGEVGADLPGPEAFDLADLAARWSEGLVFLADHPRLLYALAGHVPRERLFAALSPASLRERPVGGRSRGARERRVVEPDAGAALEEPREGEPMKTPPPARPAPARDLIGSARALGLATLAVPDVYAADEESARHQRVRVAVGRNALLCDLPREWCANEPVHLPSGDELARCFEGVENACGPFPGTDALERTLLVAEACRFAPPLDRVHFPAVELPPAQSPYSALCEQAFDGARERYRPLVPSVLRRLERELEAIEDLGYAPYFLLVRRIADFAKSRGIPCVGRGSAADSLVAFCLGLTDADPLRYRLPFERFLNPARRDRPDIDLDFCWRRRDEVLEAVYETFGARRTAMISTLNTFGLRAAFREVALVHGVPPVEVRRWTKYLPYAVSNVPYDPRAITEDEKRGLPEDLCGNPVAAALWSTPECRDFPFDDERWRRVIDGASALIDVPRHFGLHPGGVVVAPGAITEFTACHRAAKGVVVTQLDKDAIEAVGLVKMDLLGNRALTTIDDCLQILRERGVEVDWSALPEDEPETARALSEGRTLGCFQVESPGMRNLLKQMRARTMDEVIQAVALIRPGPAGCGMKDSFIRRVHGEEPSRAPHPLLDEVLAETHGVMLYQEDVMAAAVALARMDLAQADELRRGLKDREHTPEDLRASFLAGCEENGVDEASAKRAWEQIANFVSFSFCKAHAVTYGQLAWRAVWLKTHHPGPFLTAFLKSHTGYYQPRVYVEEARRLGVAIRGPDVNKSLADFSLERDALRIGLGQVRGLSERTLERLLATREADGAFLSLPDVLERVRPDVDEVEHLVRAGAFDAFDRTRPELLWRLHLLRTPKRRLPKDLAAEGLDPDLLEACRTTPAGAVSEQSPTGGWGQRSFGLGRARLGPGESAPLFPPPPPPSALALPRLPDVDARARATEELELLGLTVTIHPVHLFAREELESLPSEPIPCAELARHTGRDVTIVGWLAASRRVRTSDGTWMRFLTFEDESGLAEVVLFADAYQRHGHRLVQRGPFAAGGRVESSFGACTLHAQWLR